MGEENAFYFDEATGRWQERGKEAAPEPAPPPPPPKAAAPLPPAPSAGECLTAMITPDVTCLI